MEEGQKAARTMDGGREGARMQTEETRERMSKYPFRGSKPHMRITFMRICEKGKAKLRRLLTIRRMMKLGLVRMRYTGLSL